jgi:small subunit ribosomal protein S17
MARARKKPEETPVEETAAEETPAEETAAETPPVEEAAAETPPAAAEEPPVTEEAAATEELVSEQTAAPAPKKRAAAEKAPAKKPAAERPKKPRAKAKAKPKRKPAAERERKPIVRQPKPEHVRGHRKERRGVVVSSAMDKTIVVRVEVVKPHRRYKKVVRRSSKLHAHDEQNAAKPGDVVRVVETRPISRTKHWRLAEVVEVAQ